MSSVAWRDCKKGSLVTFKCLSTNSDVVRFVTGRYGLWVGRVASQLWPIAQVCRSKSGFSACDLCFIAAVLSMPVFCRLGHSIVSMNEWMNEWIYSLDKIKVSQAGTPRHDNCMRLPVSWKPMRTIVKTSITNKSYLVIKTYKNTYTKHNTQKADA